MAIFASGRGVPTHTSNRLQRWALILLAYEFDIKYMRTTEFGHADVLSRLIAEKRPEKEDFVIAAVQHDNLILQEHDRAMPVSFDEIGIATLQDKPMVEVLQFVSSGWPASAKHIQSGEVIKYFNIRTALSRINDCLLYRHRTVVPPRHRHAVLKCLHQAHPGISRMKSLARCYVFWPGIDRQIEDTVNACAQCQAVARSPGKALLASWPTPTGPWMRVHADFCGPIRSKWYLIIIDSFSKWPEVATMTSTTATLTISRFAEVCARLGTMTTLVTDNGPQFTSELFATYCKSEGIDHVKSPPYHPQSNGQAERFVATIKQFLEKSLSNNDVELYNFLRIYRATPNDSAPNGMSPAELMFGRRIRIPLTTLLPPIKTSTGVGNTTMETQFNRKHGAKERLFSKGEAVRVRYTPDKPWQEAQVIEPKGRSVYAILCNGKVMRAHANQLLRNKAPVTDEATIDNEILFEDYHRDLTSVAVPTTSTSVPAAPAAAPVRNNWRAVSRSSPPKLRPRRQQ